MKDTFFKPATAVELALRPKPVTGPGPFRFGKFRDRIVVHDPNMGDNEVVFGYKGHMGLYRGVPPGAGPMEVIISGDYTFLVVGANVMNLIRQADGFCA